MQDTREGTSGVQGLRDTAVALAKRQLSPQTVDRLNDARAVARRGATRAVLAGMKSMELLLPRQPRILCWPALPTPKATLYRFALMHGWKLHNDPSAPYDAVLMWEDATTVARDDVLMRLMARDRVLNSGCVDISKQHVNKVFEATFGYAIGIDPVTHVGPAVEKSDANARHDGTIVECPLEAPAPGAAYQKVIDNSEDAGYIVWRIPVVGSRIPYVWHNIKTFDHRFESGTFACRATTLVDTHDALSPDEIAAVLRFTREMGMDYGELDALRDRDDGRLYVVDANSTPHGPPTLATDPYCARASHERLAHAFAAEFLPPAAYARAGRVGRTLLRMR